MKTKDIITIVIGVCIIGASGYFLYQTMAPKATVTNVVETKTTVKELDDKEYDATLKLITEKKDYGEAALDNIGRTNPFGPLN